MKHLFLCNQVQTPGKNKENMKKNVQNWKIPKAETELVFKRQTKSY